MIMGELRSFNLPTLRVLLLEHIHPCAEETLKGCGFIVDQESGALSEDELVKRIPEYHVLGVRSKTVVSARVLEAGRKLISVCCFCIGTNQVDLDKATSKGVIWVDDGPDRGLQLAVFQQPQRW